MSNTMFKISDHVYTVEPFAGPHLTVTSFGHILKIDGDSALICFYRGLSPVDAGKLSGFPLYDTVNIADLRLADKVDIDWDNCDFSIDAC